MRKTAFLAMVCALALGGNAMAEELKVGDKAPNFELQASDGKTYKLSGLRRQAGGRAGVVPEGVHAGLHHRVQVAGGDTATDIRKYDVTYFMASVDPLEGEKGNKAFAESQKADFPLLSDPTKKTAEAYGVLKRARLRQPLDVLHRQGRQDPLHRQGREAGDVGGGHGREARRAQGRREEVTTILRFWRIIRFFQNLLESLMVRRTALRQGRSRSAGR